MFRNHLVAVKKGKPKVADIASLVCVPVALVGIFSWFKSSKAAQAENELKAREQGANDALAIIKAEPPGAAKSIEDTRKKWQQNIDKETAATGQGTVVGRH